MNFNYFYLSIVGRKNHDSSWTILDISWNSKSCVLLSSKNCVRDNTFKTNQHHPLFNLFPYSAKDCSANSWSQTRMYKASHMPIVDNEIQGVLYSPA